MKGYLNDKEAVSLFCVEEYEDGTSDFDVTGTNKDVFKLVLDALSAMCLTSKKEGKTNEDVANYVCSYILATMDMANKAMKVGAFNDLC